MERYRSPSVRSPCDLWRHNREGSCNSRSISPLLTSKAPPRVSNWVWWSIYVTYYMRGIRLWGPSLNGCSLGVSLVGCDLKMGSGYNGSTDGNGEDRGSWRQDWGGAGGWGQDLGDAKDRGRWGDGEDRGRWGGRWGLRTLRTGDAEDRGRSETLMFGNLTTLEDTRGVGVVAAGQ